MQFGDKTLFFLCCQRLTVLVASYLSQFFESSRPGLKTSNIFNPRAVTIVLCAEGEN